jgi:hypothetical protein
MNIYTAHWRHYTDDYYAAHNRRMFLNEQDANKFLDDLIVHDGLDDYYIMEETVFDQYSPTKDSHYDYDDMTGDWECGEGTLHPHTEHSCDCAEMNEELCRSQIECQEYMRMQEYEEEQCDLQQETDLINLNKI